MRSRLPGLDLLRALAISLVLMAHGALFFSSVNPPVLSVLMAGQYGVDLFFALSGWLVGGLLWDLGAQLSQPRILVGFWLSRALRTVPIYYLFLLLHLWLLPPSEGSAAERYVFFLQNFWRETPTIFFGESWSLSIEEWFYLLVPVALFLGLRSGITFGRCFLILAVGMIVFSTLTRQSAEPAASWITLNRTVIYKFDALGWGVFAVILSRLIPTAVFRWRLMAAWTGIIVVAACYYFGRFIFIQNSPLMQTWWGRVGLPALVPLGWTLLLPAAAEWRWSAAGRTARIIAAMARWSYLLYLVNLPVAMLVVHELPPSLKPDLQLALTRAGFYLVTSLVIAAFLHRWLERPVVNLRERLAWCRAAKVARASAVS